MRVSPPLAAVVAAVALALPACHDRGEPHAPESHKVVVTSPQRRDVVITQQYVCQIHSQRHIKLCALESGYLEEITVREGQAVKKGDVLFKVMPTLYQARLDAELAEVQVARIEYLNAKKLSEGNLPVVSQQDVMLHQARLAKAEAKAKLAEAELNFASVRAPFDGIVDRLERQQGSLVKEGDDLTTLSDNTVMWVYFNVPEARYLEYKARQGKPHHSTQLKLVDARVELVLADGRKFDQPAGDTVTIEGKFNNETGNIAFRADFPNPDGLLRHGQTGTVLIHQTVKDAVVIPQRATFEILDKQYVWVVGDDNVVHQRPIAIAHELEDIYVLKGGVGVADKIVLEGVQQVHENDKLTDVEFRKPGDALARQKYHAE
jgi:membrane fusion protein (multidrug efflux system)